MFSALQDINKSIVQRLHNVSMVISSRNFSKAIHQYTSDELRNSFVADLI